MGDVVQLLCNTDYTCCHRRDRHTFLDLGSSVVVCVADTEDDSHVSHVRTAAADR